MIGVINAIIIGVSLVGIGVSLWAIRTSRRVYREMREREERF